MKSDSTHHLTPEQLRQALVDRQDLMPEVHAHLGACDRCQGRLQALEQDVAQLGQLSEMLAPQATRRVVLPVDPVKPGYRRTWHLRPALGLAVTALLLLAVVWWSPLGQRSPEESLDLEHALQVWQDGSFMGEVNALVENALPRGYQALLVEPGPEWNDTLIDWMVPSEASETISRLMLRKDVHPC